MRTATANTRHGFAVPPSTRHKFALANNGGMKGSRPTVALGSSFIFEKEGFFAAPLKRELSAEG